MKWSLEAYFRKLRNICNEFFFCENVEQIEIIFAKISTIDMFYMVLNIPLIPVSVFMYAIILMKP